MESTGAVGGGSHGCIVKSDAADASGRQTVRKDTVPLSMQFHRKGVSGNMPAGLRGRESSFACPGRCLSAGRNVPPAVFSGKKRPSRWLVYVKI